MRTYHAYTAKPVKGPLEPFTYHRSELRPERVETKVTHGGLCNSELSLLDDRWRLTEYPFVDYHEPSGTVFTLGEEDKG
ncbi:MAG: alcohol dehydrogenase [Chthoniobacteraceae bacterium]|nr:alcohol dehydrogenase [Chthoniobacteraceae bacterium]